MNVVYRFIGGPLDGHQEHGGLPHQPIPDDDELRAAILNAPDGGLLFPNDGRSGAYRPFGWSGWRRWPEIGLELRESGQLLHWRTPRHPTPGVPPALERGGAWPFTPAKRATDVLWARILEHCEGRLDRPTYRDLAAVFGVGRGSIERCLKEHHDEWEGLFDD